MLLLCQFIKKFQPWILNILNMKSKFKKLNPISTGSWVPENVNQQSINLEKTYTIIVNKLVIDASIFSEAGREKSGWKLKFNSAPPSGE